MAMTMSDNMSASNDWFQFYQQHQQNIPGGVPSSSISDATAVTTVVSPAGATATSPTLATLNSTSSASTSSHLSPEGRVAKPVRRRSRASRRTPTTLLNTDTTNFRAMVQQFTGGPSAPFAPTASSSSAASGLGSLGFGFGPRQAHVGPTGLMVAPPGYHLQQQQHLYHQQQNQQYMFNSSEGGENNNRFFQRLSNNPRGPSNVTDLGIGGFVMDQGGVERFFPSTS